MRHSCAFPGLWAFALIVSLITPLVSAAAPPNAWQISDTSSTAGGGSYRTNLLAAQQDAALAEGWRYSIHARFVEDLNDTFTMVFFYGVGTNRFSIFWDLDNNNDLTATPFNHPTVSLTTNGTGAAFYHTHEIIYDPVTRQAAYLFDGIHVTSWGGDGGGVTAPNGLIAWGSGSSPGQGTMNFHTATFTVGTNVMANYDAGIQSNPAVAPDPQSQGWAAVGAAPGTTNAVSPDAVSLPSALVATTLAASTVQPHEAILPGTVDLGGLAALAWIEWGATTNYGNTSSPQFLKAGPAAASLSLALDGLAQGTTYHFRCVATNLLGAAYGQDVEFTTPPGWVVTTLADSGPGSLREAVNAAVSGDTITFATNGTILLTSGQLSVSKNLTIPGPGATNLVIDANRQSRIFRILSGTTNTFSGITITRGVPPVGLDGGGIHNAGTLTLIACVVTGNGTRDGQDGVRGDDGVFGSGAGKPGTDAGDGGDGGGIYNVGSLTLLASTIYDNDTGWGGVGGSGGDAFLGDGGDGGDGGSGGWGGGLYNASGASLTLSNCTVAGNLTGGGGPGGGGGSPAGLGTGGTSGSEGEDGDGGGIFNASAVFALTACTVAGNGARAGEGGGIITVSGSSTALRNTLVADNHPGDLRGASFRSHGHNLVGCNDGLFILLDQSPTDIVLPTLTSTNALLLPLYNYGGPTPTTGLRIASPAIDAGDDTLVASLPTDQRGVPRLLRAHVDIGAFEAQEPIVQNTNDSGPGSLRDALPYSSEYLTFVPGLSGQTIRLTSGQLTISRPLTLDASALPGGIALDAGQNSRVLEIAAPNVTLDSVTVMNGSAAAGGGILVNPGGQLTLYRSTVASNSATFAGGIDNRGVLSVRASTIVGNSATNNSGGIENNAGTVFIYESLISSNSAAFGGGFGNWDGGSMTIDRSTFAANSATSRGGGGYNVGSLITIFNSTFSDNSARSGGVVYNFENGEAYLVNSTLSRNRTTERGAGIVNNTSALYVRNSTVAGNQAGTEGGGILNSSGVLQMLNTIVAGNFASSNANVSGVFSGQSSLTSGDPRLAPLGDHGGPTGTMLPLTGSPAIDAGADIGIPGPTDQRGYRRISGAHVDIGAVEVQVPNPNNAPVLTQPALLPNGALQLSFTNDPGIAFSVYASTNVALPSDQWLRLGAASQPSAGLYRFTDSTATNHPQRFYVVTWP